jgi:hypothetical protein
MASDITITDLTAEGAANQVGLTWSVDDPNIGRLPYLQFSHAEIRYADNEAMTGAVTLSTSVQYAYNHMNLLPGAEYWYQARAIDYEGQEGEWCDPVNGQENTIDSSAVATPWDDFDISVSAFSGSITSYSAGVCRGKQAALLQFFTIQFTITDHGTAGEPLIVRGIPNVHPTSHLVSCSGYRESNAGSPDVWEVDMDLVVHTQTDTTTSPSGVQSQLAIWAYDGSNAAGSNKRYTLTGFFEIDP